ncbi:hypothetical protein RMSM_00582 [Rhodopirellula maiorica SM1]|uniref:Uncharacterized protein n=1 Tax=Rhodopirellula maiorica SM1 TaxID=1265738 RepID=M5RT25_9BACT|nr:hypothetical protein [Rhodopirellula maiorica]EMI22493.1 hypothetical protein RMSM_00582 [Rhodopirellula maiorica SM1]
MPPETLGEFRYEGIPPETLGEFCYEEFRYGGSLTRVAAYPPLYSGS